MQQRMRDIGFAVASMGVTTVIGGSQSTASDFEPRAVLEVRLNYYDSVEEPVTNIESVEVTGTVEPLDPFVFQVDVD